MCGIAAIISPGNVEADSLQRMLDAIRHRGPDDEGWVSFGGRDFSVAAGGGADTPNSCFDAELPYTPSRWAVMGPDARVAIGHRRLAIVDVSPSGHQPMSYMGDRYWIVFNGEIYNHVALREELEGLGCRFVSHSDTEVILAAYATWGDACLDRLEGMFAFVLVDRDLQMAFLARDRFGIKPLYYWVAPDGTLAVASEIKQFTVLPGWQATLNAQRAYDFLAWGIIDHTDETLFEGVFQFRPGSSTKIACDRLIEISHEGRLHTSLWYQLSGSQFKGEFEQACEQFQTLFREAVSSHLRADVQVGSCLSGGLDSSSIVCMADRLLDEAGSRLDQHTFSACAVDKRFDERAYIEEVVRSAKCSAHYIYPEFSDLLAQLEQLTWHQDEPFGSTSIFAQWSVCALAAKNGVKVLLDGQGADEQLAGYRGYYGANFVNLLVRMKWWKLTQEIRAMSRTQGGGLSWAIKYIAEAMLPSRLRFFLRKMIGRETAVPGWLNMQRLGAIPRDPVRADEGASLSIHELSLRQLKNSNLQMLLHWEDRNSMAHSIESRVPFLDRRLVEFDLGLPDEFKLSDGITKRVLRQGLRGILPEMISSRMNKLGFATPEEVWVRQQAPDYFLQAVRDAVDSTQGILTPEAIQVAGDIISGKRAFDFQLWRWISFSVWMKCFDVQLAVKGQP